MSILWGVCTIVVVGKKKSSFHSNFIDIDVHIACEAKRKYKVNHCYPPPYKIWKKINKQMVCICLVGGAMMRRKKAKGKVKQHISPYQSALVVGVEVKNRNKCNNDVPFVILLCVHFILRLFVGFVLVPWQFIFILFHFYEDDVSFQLAKSGLFGYQCVVVEVCC